MFEFKAGLTLFEGRNGSGKTSLLNAIVWVFTGELLRAQREPECTVEYDCFIAPENANGEPTTHRISAVTPLPAPQLYRPGSVVPADTWVELVLEDEDGSLLPPIRRSVSRNAKNKLQETTPDFSSLGVDPIALRLGTTMPGLLQLIRVGSSSELGKAVAQLTGLSALVDLGDHVRRAKGKITGDLTRSKRAELDRFDASYRVAKGDLAGAVVQGASATLEPPEPSEDPGIEKSLAAITAHYEKARTAAFDAAREVLGDEFDPASAKVLNQLEEHVGGAIERASKPGELPSAKRLSAMRLLTPEQLDQVSKDIDTLLTEGAALRALAENPSLAARKRLYARVASWIADHPVVCGSEENCAICSSDLRDKVDPVTGRVVTEHLKEASNGAELLSLTLAKWADGAQAKLLQSLPEALRVETVNGLPDHPCSLMRSALVDELFSYDVFVGVLQPLKATTAARFDETAKAPAPLGSVREISLPGGFEALERVLRRLDTALRFARWRQENKDFEKDLFSSVLTGAPESGTSSGGQSLRAKLFVLGEIVKATTPISEALKQCGRLKQYVGERRAAEKRLQEYKSAEQALDQIAEMGRLADEQVAELRLVLSEKAAAWRKKIYRGAFPSTAHDLVDTPVGRKGELGLMMRSAGASAPAEYVSNASALRASLVAFYLAFREYVLDQRGGIVTLLLDEPQELLDDENRDRFAASLADVVGNGAQVVVTSYDARFCTRVAKLTPVGGVAHLAVFPATDQQPVVRLSEPLTELAKRSERFEKNPDNEECARDFADACRVFLESKLGDLFDDPAYSAWVSENRDPTLATFVQRLRVLARASAEGMFSHPVFKRFVDHSALADGSPVTTLMNKAHHGRRMEIRAADVAECLAPLQALLELAEEMYAECLRWKKREPVQKPSAAVVEPPSLTPLIFPSSARPIPVYPSLAASTQSSLAATQEATELLDAAVFESKAAFLLRRENFGFAAPLGSIAIVDAVEGPVEDRRLVIARTAQSVFARRLVKAKGAEIVGLTADTPDPRTRAPKTMMVAEADVQLHRVVGIIFEHSLTTKPGPEEAVPVESESLFKQVVVAFRVTDQSAVPLALNKQVVLAGEDIELSCLNRQVGKLVAIALDDGSSQFKRVGASLAGDLHDLRQFESIGGLGSSQIFSVGKPMKGFLNVVQVKLVLGVLYNA